MRLALADEMWVEVTAGWPKAGASRAICAFALGVALMLSSRKSRPPGATAASFKLLVWENVTRIRACSKAQWSCSGAAAKSQTCAQEMFVVVSHQDFGSFASEATAD